MDKKQATQHVLTRLQAGNHPGEIAEELSRILKAPAKVTGRFVNQVAASHPEEIPAPPMPSQKVDTPVSDAPDWMEPLPFQTTPVSEPATPTTATNSQKSDLPPGLQALIDEAATLKEPQESRPEHKPAPTSEIDLPQQVAFVPAVAKSETIDGDFSQKIDLESLNQEVLKQLKKQKRFNDVIEFVCHNTGWHWNKAQRFVARVKTKHHDELMSGKNRVTIVIGLVIIIVGLVMMLNGASVLSDYAKLAVFARTNPEALFAMSPQAIFFALMAAVTGIGMIIGGGYGVGRALTNR